MLPPSPSCWTQRTPSTSSSKDEPLLSWYILFDTNHSLFRGVLWFFFLLIWRNSTGALHETHNFIDLDDGYIDAWRGFPVTDGGAFSRMGAFHETGLAGYLCGCIPIKDLISGSSFFLSGLPYLPPFLLPTFSLVEVDD